MTGEQLILPQSKSSEGIVVAQDRKRSRVLVVDDQLAHRHALTLLLDDEGYVTETAADTGSGKRKLLNRSFDLVISDIHMPGDGYLLLDWIRRERPDTPVILVTGGATRGDRARARRKGAAGFLEKPIDVSRLLQMIRTASTRNGAAAHE